MPSSFIISLLFILSLIVFSPVVKVSIAEPSGASSIIQPIEPKKKSEPRSILSPAEIAKLPPDGGKHFNRLIFQGSPYLLQHAENPIDWYPWGDEPFKKALQEDKPIFLSIGYTTCHWCHVMEDESFEDEGVAKILNREYICIKIDREERPDVDNIYMSVTQMMTGRGGWPMTIIMSPDKIPFFAGTYFSKESMMQLLPHFANIWKNERKKVQEIGEAIIKSLQELEDNRAGGNLNKSHLVACFFALKQDYDSELGGFGNAPKFPTPHTLSFLLRYHKRTGNREALEMVKKSLKKIHRGGIYDQIGLGIHRYSTDQKWLVPHFEKMLYDQALFALANLECFQVTKESYYERIANEVLSYVVRNMTSPQGGFYSAEDADSEGEEGKFYVWSVKEIKDILGPENTQLFADLYQLQDGGNFKDETTNKKNGYNIPHLRVSIEEYAKEKNLNSFELNKKIAHLKNLLFQEREKRVRPEKDKKILTDWNGLMISAFSRSAMTLNNEDYLLIAKKAADFCLSYLRKKDGTLLKRWIGGHAALPAHLDDYAFLSQGLLDLFEASFEEKYLRTSIELIDLALFHFEDNQGGGFFLSSKSGEKLLIQSKKIYDGAIPSGNAVMALNLLRLNKITGEKKYLTSAKNLFSAFSGFLEENPRSSEMLMQALDFALAPAKEIIIAEKKENIENSKLLSEIRKKFLPSKVLLWCPLDSEQHKIFKISPYLKNYLPEDNKPTVYICENYTCQKPVKGLKELRKALDKY